MTADERAAWYEEQMAIQEKRLGLDQPFLIRSFLYLSSAMTLDFGFSENLASDSGSREVRLILLERLPSTLVLFATAQITVFFSAIFLALPLSRRYGSWLDKLIVMLTPSSAAPGWFYGLFFILIFAGLLRVLPFGGMVAAPPPENPVEYALSLGRHLILPVGAIAASALALTTYTWRTFFLIYSHEDYVELAKAKGLPERHVHSRYILRPTLPTILTNFALTLIALWTGAIITETVFNWPGLGRTLFTAINLYDTPVIVASTVIYAYLLALTVFLLDLAYAFIDPRVKIGNPSKA
jgi:peptide/nickel transport system permease protein